MLFLNLDFIGMCTSVIILCYHCDEILTLMLRIRNIKVYFYCIINQSY